MQKVGILSGLPMTALLFEEFTVGVRVGYSPCVLCRLSREYRLSRRAYSSTRLSTGQARKSVSEVLGGYLPQLRRLGPWAVAANVKAQWMFVEMLAVASYFDDHVLSSVAQRGPHG